MRRPAARAARARRGAGLRGVLSRGAAGTRSRRGGRAAAPRGHPRGVAGAGGDAAMTPLVARSDHDGVAELVLDRPERRNAFTTGLLRELREHLRALDGCSAVLLTGA